MKDDSDCKNKTIFMRNMKNLFTGKNPIEIVLEIDETELRHKEPQSPEVFYKKCVLRNFSKFTGKYLCQSFFLTKLLLNTCGGCF